MAFDAQRARFAAELEAIRASGMWKTEQLITSAQEPRLEVTDDLSIPSRPSLNLCANNYLGLANHPEVIEASCRATREHGFGMASVRFICGTHSLHRSLETELSAFLGTDDTILYSSCFDANAGLFETLLGPEDAIISDELNHASIIDGIRLTKARRRIFRHADMDDLRAALDETREARMQLVVTDGVFSMHGDLAPLPEICDLTDEHGALLVVDDSHATGFLGANGRGTPEHWGVSERVDIITSTLGKALGGASGGFSSGRAEIVELLRQRSRPYLFSNAVAPGILGAARKVLELIAAEPERRETLRENTRYFRDEMAVRGFEIVPGEHPIVPIVLGDEVRTVQMATELNRRGVFVVGFTFPVVPKGSARIRVQVSAAHSREDLSGAIDQFEEVGVKLGVLA